MEAYTPDVDYPVTLGPSLAPPGKGKGGAGASYAALRYDFKPASADAEHPGVLVVGPDSRVRDVARGCFACAFLRGVVVVTCLVQCIPCIPCVRATVCVRRWRSAVAAARRASGLRCLAQVSLYLANTSTAEWDVLLAGKFEAGRDGLDCVAVFDGGGFRLEGLIGQITTK